MTMSDQSSSLALPDEHGVMEFLRRHPTFLDEHPELLKRMTIPHESGEAVSLLERQMVLLREENQQLKQQLDRLVQFARDNENLNARIHDLALRLMNAVGPRAISDLLARCLREDFGADRVGGLIFADTSSVDQGEVVRFVGVDSTARDAFGRVLEDGGTACGALSEAQCEALFGGDTDVASAVTMPLLGGKWQGVLVIASADAGRYQAGMGTEFLTYLKDIVALVLDPWVKSRA